MVTAGFIYEKSASALSPATEVTFVDGKVSIPLKQVYDGELHRFDANEGGVEVRFLLYQKPDGKDCHRCSTPAKSAARSAFTKERRA